MSIDFDFGELNRLVADLQGTPDRVIPKVRQAVEISARELKDSWSDYAKQSSGRHARRYPGSIDYDMQLDSDGEIGAKIGPNLNKPQGALGILEAAPGGVRATPQRAQERAERDTLLDFETGLLRALEAGES